MISAVEFGKWYGSCPDAMRWRRAELPAGATQADAFRACPRGDWMIWQLTRDDALGDAEAATQPLIDAAVTEIVGRAVERYALRCGVPSVEAWAQRWLSGEDRSRDAAAAARDAEEREWRRRATRKTARAVAAARAAVSAARADVAEAAVDAVEAAWADGEKALEEQAAIIRKHIPAWPGI